MIPEGLESSPVEECLSSVLRILGSTPSAKQQQSSCKDQPKDVETTWKLIFNMEYYK